MAETEEELKSLLMEVKEESEKAGLKLKIQKPKIMASGPFNHFMANRWGNNENSDMGSKITADNKDIILIFGFTYTFPLQNHCIWWPHQEIKRHLLLGRKAMTNLDSMLKRRDIILPTKVHLVKAMVFPVVRYGCQSWTIKKAEHQRTDAFELWY